MVPRTVRPSPPPERTISCASAVKLSTRLDARIRQADLGARGKTPLFDLDLGHGETFGPAIVPSLVNSKFPEGSSLEGDRDEHEEIGERTPIVLEGSPWDRGRPPNRNSS